MAVRRRAPVRLVERIPRIPAGHRRAGPARVAIALLGLVLLIAWPLRAQTPGALQAAQGPTSPDRYEVQAHVLGVLPASGSGVPHVIAIDGRGEPAALEAARAAHPGSFVSPVLLDADARRAIPGRRLIVAFDTVLGEDEVAQRLPDGCRISRRAIGGMRGVHVVETPARDGFETMVYARLLAATPGVRYADADMYRQATRLSVPNDPLFSSSWGLRNNAAPGIDIGVVGAWDTTRGEADVLVVVLDDGVQLDHPDLPVAMGADFTDEPSPGATGAPVNECDTHATRVAGIVGAAIDNAIGSAGVAPGCTLASARVFVSNDPPCNATGLTRDSWIIDALAWADGIGARVTNTSLSLGASQAVAEMYALTRAHGMLHVGAAGNEGSTVLDAPARFGDVISVGSIEQSGSLAPSSNRGPDLDFVAPGVGVLTTDRTGVAGDAPSDFDFASGTSFASPFCSGVLALGASGAPYLESDALESLLALGALDLGDTGDDPVFGRGLVRAGALIDALPRRADARFTALRDTAGGADTTGANAIARDGWAVVGDLDLASSHPFRRSAHGRNMPLGVSGAPVGGTALAASDAGAGVVVGEFTRPGGGRAFAWERDGSVTELGVLNDIGFGASRATGVSADAGVIVGWASVEPGVQHAFRWTAGGGMESLGAVGAGAEPSSEALGVSADGRVVVGATDTLGVPRAFRWDEQHGMQLLASPGASASIARAASADGSVIVGDVTIDGVSRAARWVGDAEAEILGELPGFGGASSALGVSADGRVIVGAIGASSEMAPESLRAFIWSEGQGMGSAADVLGDAGAPVDGWSLLIASGVTGDGLSFVGTGVSPDGTISAWFARLPMGPDAFDLSLPAPDAQGLTTAPAFQWEPADEADDYLLVIDDDEDLSSPVVEQPTALTFFQLGASTLEPATAYAWTVFARSAGGQTRASGPVRRFSTDGPVPGVFVLAQPLPGQTIDSTTPAFTWSSSTGAHTYVLEIAVDDEASTPVYTTDVPAAPGASVTLALAPGILENNTSYRWSVRASNAVGEVASIPASAAFAVAAPDACPGDVNADGTADVADIEFTIVRLGSGELQADANGDGEVNILDITYVIFRLGTCP